MEHGQKYCIIFLILFFSGITTVSAAPDIPHAVGQMMMVGFKGVRINAQSPIVQAIKQYHIGGVILFDHFDRKRSGRWITRNIRSPAQLKRLTRQLQYYAKKYHDLPLFIAVNQEGGVITALKTKKGFKLDEDYSQKKLGRLNNQKIIYKQALYRGQLLKRYGINVNLAPVADLEINPNNPAVAQLQRSFGRNAVKVIKDLMTTIKAYKKSGILCTLKHFPGLGSSATNTDFKTADVTQTWRFSELIPYRQLIKAHHACRVVMVTHLINRRLDKSAIAASLSHKIVTGLLRRHLHYRGLIITDDMDAKAIRDHVPIAKAIRLAVLAGNTIILYGGTQGYDAAQDTTTLYHTMMKLAANNPQTRRQIMKSYNRISDVKRTVFANFSGQLN